MIGPRSLRAALAIAAFGWIFPSGALAAESSDCVAPQSLTVHVDPGPDVAISRKVESEIASELRSTPTTPCWHLPDPAEGPKVHIEVKWPKPTHARVVLVATTTRRVHYGIRDLDLQKLPKDGIPLAVAIAADELMETIGEQVAQEGPLLVPPSTAPPVITTPAPAALPPPPLRRLAFGPAAAIDVLGGNLVLAGPDAQLIVPLATTFSLGLHVGTRGSLESQRHAPLKAAAAWVAGASLRIGPQSRRNTFAVSAGLDALALKVNGENDSVTKALAIARVGLATSTLIAPGLRATADIYVGGALSSVRARLDDGTTRPFGEGLAIGGALGLVALF